MFEDTNYKENEVALDNNCCVGAAAADTDCCCVDHGSTSLNACTDSTTLPVTATLKCTGQLLIVNVSVHACKGRKVAVGVLICDSADTPIRFKVNEDFMPTGTGTDPCTDKTFKFCFVFKTNDLCTATSLKVKTFAEYASFSNLPCNCVTLT